MPKACVQQKMKPKSKGGQGMTRAAAMKACYPKRSKFKDRRTIKKIEKKWDETDERKGKWSYRKGY